VAKVEIAGGGPPRSPRGSPAWPPVARTSRSRIPLTGDLCRYLVLFLPFYDSRQGALRLAAWCRLFVGMLRPPRVMAGNAVSSYEPLAELRGYPAFCQAIMQAGVP
jgi:hypothetical protein